MKQRLILFCFFLLVFFGIRAFAAEYNSGDLRLVIDERTGRFSLYALSSDGRTQEALFSDQDPRTSFLSVLVNDRAYKMGESSAFGIRLDSSASGPGLIFESSFLTVRQDFSFIQGPDALRVNGIAVTVTLENRSAASLSVGARCLLDTMLSEGSGAFFVINRETVNTELLVSEKEGPGFWTDKNSGLSLTGSLPGSSPGESGNPDSVHFANWKKLSEVSWKAPFHRGRNFDAPPYSAGDTALCYYYEPRSLGPGEKRSFGFTLALNAENGLEYGKTSPGAVSASGGESDSGSADSLSAEREKDMAALKELIARIDAHIAAGTASEEELAAIESALNEFRAKYGSGVNSQ